MARKTIFLLSVMLILLISVSLAVDNSSITFTVFEGDVVKLNPTILDLDQDKIFIYYFAPLDKNGEWQTTKEDAGIYQTKIIASDGKNETEQKVTLVVKNKNQAPIIKGTQIIANEGELIDLKKAVSDPDKDVLKLTFGNPFDNKGSWQTNYLSAGNYSVLVTADDGEFKIKKNIPLLVKEKNAPPFIISSFSSEKTMKIKENSSFNFYVNATDVDGDSLKYLWKIGGKNISNEKNFDYYFDFYSAGKHQLDLQLSDGIEKIFTSWILDIEDVNQPPQINLSEKIMVKEGEKVVLNLPRKDLDGDILIYTYYAPFNNNTWKTTYQDAGNYSSLVVVSDGKVNITKKFNIVVDDVDRAPSMNLKKISVYEGSSLTLNLNQLATDPDGDKLTFKIDQLPSGANLQEGVLNWSPNYNFVQRKNNFFTNFLNRIKLENFFFMGDKKVNLVVTACGLKLCSNETLTIAVKNTNRKPSLSQINNIDSIETQIIQLSPSAVDLDGDVIRYHYGKPFDRKGKWETGYLDAGTYQVPVTVSDGYLTETQRVNITVKNLNRKPTFDLKDTYFKLNENELFTLKLSARDEDNDKLNITSSNLSSGASLNNGVFTYIPSYDTVKNSTDKNIYAKFSWLNKRFNPNMKHLRFNFTVSDGQEQDNTQIVINVKNVNRAPKINDYFPTQNLIVEMNKPVIFYVNATDVDGDELKYEWSFGLWDTIVSGSPYLNRTFTEPGFKTVKIVVSDGIYSDEMSWIVKVNPNNIQKEDKTVIVKQEKVVEKQIVYREVPIESPKYNTYVIEH